MTRPIAILVSDLHLSHNPPAARSAEPDWYAAMRRQWDQVRNFSVEEGGLPVVIAGDVFDQWRSPPELINFAIELFAGLEVFAVPGQHDLPNHVYGDMYRSAYGTLVAAGAIQNASSMEQLDGLTLWPYPWGFEVESLAHCQSSGDGVVHLAVCHRYVWTNDKNCFPGAPQEANLACLKDKLIGYDAAVFGDNHRGFLAKSGSCNVLNCGGFMPRKSDERDYVPSFGLLKDDGTIERIFFDVSKDRWIDLKDEAALIDEQLNLSGLIGELEHLGCDALNFAEVLERYLDKEKVDESVRRLVIQALEKGREDEA
jgi:hypothetical protein